MKRPRSNVAQARSPQAAPGGESTPPPGTGQTTGRIAPSLAPETRQRLTAAEEQWERGTLRRALDRMSERREKFETLSGIGIKRLYTPLDVADVDPVTDVGFPGDPPFTRGIHATMHRGRLWTMRMFAGFGSAEQTNERFHYLLRQGQTGLSVAFDLPTLYGRDTDDPWCAGEFGHCGVAVSSLADMEVLFDGIPLADVTTSMTINGPAAIIWAMYIAVAEKQGVPLDRLGGTLQNDILKEFIAQKEFIFPPQPSVRLVVDTIEFATRYLPRWNPISISGYHIREAGSTAVQELAFTLADGLAYVQACVDRGLAVDEFAPRLSFFFNSHNDFFEEIAKFRAARRLWSKLMAERFGPRDPRSLTLRFHTQTAGCSLTAQQPENNVVRTTLQALAAVLGGTQSLHTNALDEALALPSEKAARIALRTQQIIAHESGVADVVDPLGGSYYVETLTNEVEARAREYIERVDRLGGVIVGIENGFFQREIQETATAYQAQVDRGERIVVGVNEFAGDDEPIPLLRLDPRWEQKHRDRLDRVRRERDQTLCRQRLAELRLAATEGDNLMPPILNAVRAYATLGEMVGVLRDVFGEYSEQPVV